MSYYVNNVFTVGDNENEALPPPFCCSFEGHSTTWHLKREKKPLWGTGLEPFAGHRLIGLYLGALPLQLPWVDEYISM